MSWKVKSQKVVASVGYFKVISEECELPDGRVMPSYFTMTFPNWVHVIAIDKDGNMVVVDQYRHSAKEVCLEVPGGTLDPHTAEDEAEAALRELTEETGYSGTLTYIGEYYPNPALQDNKIHVYIATDCEKVAEPNLDPYEDLTVKLLPVKDVYKLVDKGKVTHGLMLATLQLVKPHLKDYL